MDLVVTQVTTPEQFIDLEEQWTSLLDECYHLSFFLTWQWLNLWWQTYALPSDQLKIIVIKKHGAIIAIIPLYIQNKATLRFIGTGENEADEVATEYLDIICHLDNQKIVIEALKRELANTPVQRIIFNNYLAHSSIAQLSKAISEKYWHNIYLSGAKYSADLSSAENDLEKIIDKSLLKKLNRAKRKFQHELRGSHLSFNTTEKFLEGYSSLKHLHELRWQKQQQQGVFASNKFEKFHQQFCQYAIAKGWLKLNILAVGERDICAVYCISFQQKTYFYQSGIDDEFKPNISPGLLMHLLQIELCIEEKQTSYDFMKGKLHNSYKEKMSNQKVLMYHAEFVKKAPTNVINMLKFCIKKIKAQLNNG